MGEVVVNLNQILDKTLYSKAKVNIRRNPSFASPLLKTTKSGDNIGRVYSYVKDKSGNLWWELYEDYGAGKYNSWVLHNPAYIDYDKLKQQGTKTIEEEEAEKNKHWYDSLISNAMKIGWVVVAIYGGVQIYKAVKK